MASTSNVPIIEKTTFQRYEQQHPYENFKSFYEKPEQPEYPNKITLLSRIISFENLSKWSVNAKKLSEAGFFTRFF